MPRTFRVAVFGRTGRGNYGHHLDTEWLQIPHAEVVAVADENAQGRAQAAQRLKVDRAFADYRQMLDEVHPDILTIGPRWLDMHAEVAIAAAERGIHVFMEKPFCRTLAEADAIVAACEMRHVKLALAHPTGYSPVIKTAHRLLNEGAIGQVLELRARGKEDARGGGEDLWVLGCHLFDLILEFGFHPEWCSASVLQGGEPVQREHVYEGNEGIGLLAGDAVRATYGLREGITATFQSYRNARGNPSRFALQIYGSQGVMDVMEGTLAPVHILQDPSWCPGRSGAQWQPVSSAGIGEPEPLTDPKYQQRHSLAMEDLLDAIENEREPHCNMYRAREIVQMIAAVFESHRQGKPVGFPLIVRENPLALL